MKQAGAKNIVLTIWYDNLFGCTNKCRFCNLSTPMVDSMDWENEALFEFLTRRHEEIRLIKFMGQEPYRQDEMLKTIAKLREIGFKKSIINLTSIGSSIYHDLMDEIGYMTLSFSGYPPEYYGFKSKQHPYKKNIVTIIEKYHDKIDKVNWIIWKFNFHKIDTDIEDFLQSIDFRKLKFSFLLQKGDIYTKEDVILFAEKVQKIKHIFEKYELEVFEKVYTFYDTEYRHENDLLENTEITYCYNRQKSKKWYRCTWEIPGEHQLEDPEGYLKWEYANNCTKTCAWEKFSTSPQLMHLFYQKLMLKHLRQMEDLVKKHTSN